MRYTVLLDPNPDGGYTVTVPSLRGCITEGLTFEEAIDNAHEAIAGFLEMLTTLGEPIPQEEPGLIAVSVEVEAPMGLAAPVPA